MGIVIAICNSKTALIFADSRKITPVEEGFLIDDEFDKIFRFNDRLLVGMTGTLSRNEEICAPFANTPYISLNVDSGCEIVIRYIKEHEENDEKLPHRNYIFAGLDKHKRICIAFVSYDDNGTISTEKVYGKDCDKVLISLPPLLQKDYAIWNKRLANSLQTKDGIETVKKG